MLTSEDVEQLVTVSIVRQLVEVMNDVVLGDDSQIGETEIVRSSPVVIKRNPRVTSTKARASICDSRFCAQHDILMKFFCFTCKALVCSECFLSSHEDHPYEYVSAGREYVSGEYPGVGGLPERAEGHVRACPGADRNADGRNRAPVRLDRVEDSRGVRRPELMCAKTGSGADADAGRTRGEQAEGHRGAEEHARGAGEWVCFSVVPIVPLVKNSSVRVSMTALLDGGDVKISTTELPAGGIEATYRPTTRGWHRLCVDVGGSPAEGSPFSVLVTLPLTRLKRPVGKIVGVNCSHGMAFNHKGMMVVAELGANRVTIRDRDGMNAIELEGHRFNHPWGGDYGQGGTTST
eukprot:Em0472g5a